MTTKRDTETLYRTIGNWKDDVYTETWEKWLWGTNCNALPLEQCWDMNEMHIYGILCAINESCYHPSLLLLNKKTIDIVDNDNFPDLSVIHLQHEKCIGELSLRELLDQIECLQLNWGKIIGVLMDCGKLDIAKDLLKGLLARTGIIAHHAYEVNMDILDDPQHITVLPNAMTATPNSILKKTTFHNKSSNNDDNDELPREYAIISRKSLRQIMCVLCALFRVGAIVEKAHKIPLEKESLLKRVVFSLKQHHIESSMDFYNVFQQMVYLAPGMRLVYRTNFAGMYNDVSQVIYFHYPRYCRQPQLPLNDIPNSNLHLLPLISQMIPDIPVYYDDDTYIPGITNENLIKQLKTNNTNQSIETTNGKLTDDMNLDIKMSPTITEKEAEKDSMDYDWAWLVSCGEVFLLKRRKQISTSLMPPTSQILLSEDHSLVNLVAYFLRETKRKLGDDMLDMDENVVCKISNHLTAHGHLQIESFYDSMED